MILMKNTITFINLCIPNAMKDQGWGLASDPEQQTRVSLSSSSQALALSVYQIVLFLGLLFFCATELAVLYLRCVLAFWLSLAFLFICDGLVFLSKLLFGYLFPCLLLVHSELLIFDTGHLEFFVLWFVVNSLDVLAKILLLELLKNSFCCAFSLPSSPRYYIREGYRCIFGGREKGCRGTSAVGFGHGKNGTYASVFEFPVKGGAKTKNTLKAQVDFPDFDNVEEAMADLRSNIVAPRSGGIYSGSIVKFLVWIYHNEKQLLSPDCAAGAASVVSKEKFFKSWLRNAPNNPPINFDNLTVPIFMSWILSVRKKNGMRPGTSQYGTHRSGLFNLFRAYELVMPRDFEKQLGGLYRGLKRKVALNIAAGGGKIKVGKDPLAFSLFRFLGLSLLLQDFRDSVFARTFMIIAWNLMARSANTFEICIQHMEWQEDALCIYFSQMKNDQFGERPRDPRHIYANPLCPEICGILALGMYWSCYAFEEGEIKLFPGNNQYERFRKILSRLVLLESVVEELERRSVDPESLGTHSMRKGASTFCASGSTSCPSSAAVHLRAGWTLNGVQDTYIRYESAGDMYVGRTVSGLPIDSPDFAILPPYFKNASPMLIQNALKVVFPNLPTHLTRIGEFGMASLVFHHDYLRKTLPATHPLFCSILFRSSKLYEELKAYVVCETPSSNSTMRATGVPAHVSILAKLQEMSDSWKKNIETQNENVTKIVQGVMQQLEEKAVGLGTVTHAGLQDAIMKGLKEAGVMRVIEFIENPAPKVPQESVAATSTRSHPNPIHHWGGKFHYFPETFQFPSSGVLEAWRYWCVGDESNGYPPLKRLTPDELATKNLKKRLSDFKFLMKKIEDRATQLGLSKANPTEEEAIEIYNACCDVIPIASTTETGKRRRIGQLTWLTAVDILRSSTKASKTTNCENNQATGSVAEEILDDDIPQVEI